MAYRVDHMKRHVFVNRLGYGALMGISVMEHAITRANVKRHPSITFLKRTCHISATKIQYSSDKYFEAMKQIIVKPDRYYPEYYYNRYYEEHYYLKKFLNQH